MIRIMLAIDKFPQVKQNKKAENKIDQLHAQYFIKISFYMQSIDNTCVQQVIELRLKTFPAIIFNRQLVLVNDPLNYF